jgi:NADPH:quinone reductase-like Zn-dependent oxidoreductase
LAGLTALQALHGCAHLHSRPQGARVLVIGAAGGIGCFAVQLAAAAGAHVTGVARSSALPAVADLGAHEVLAREDWDPSGAEGRWDVVIDTPGSVTAAVAETLLADQGVLVSTRPISRDALLARVRPGRLGRGRTYTAVMTSARSHDLARLARLVDAERLRVVIDSVHDVEHAAEAHRRAEAHPFGKVVVRF